MQRSEPQEMGDDQPEEDEGDEDADVLDIYDTGLSNLFSIPPIAFSSSSSGLFTFHPPTGSRDTRPVRLKIPNPSSEVFTKLQANHLWLSALYLADLTCTNGLELGPRVIELGAGAGLPGIMACRRGSEVLSTDWGDESILECLEENFRRNCKGGWGVMGHEWATDPSPLLTFGSIGHLASDTALSSPLESTGTADVSPSQFDDILLADTLWISSAHDALLDSVQALLRPDGTAHLAAGLHTGRWPVESFIKKAGVRGMHIERVREVRWAGEGDWETMPDDDREGVSWSEEERGVIVYLRLSWGSSSGNVDDRDESDA